MTKRKASKPVSLAIRSNRNGMYVVTNNPLSMIEEDALCLTIEDVERAVSSLLRRGKFPKPVG